jgi:hypothetical protein
VYCQQPIDNITNNILQNITAYYKKSILLQKLREPLSILIKYKTTVTPKINILIFQLSTKIQSSSGMINFKKIAYLYKKIAYYIGYLL